MTEPTLILANTSMLHLFERLLSGGTLIVNHDGIYLSNGTVHVITPPPPPVTPPDTPPVVPPPHEQCLFGVYDPASDGDAFQGWSGGDGGVQQFESAPVKVGTYYVQWQGDFPANLAKLCTQHNAKLFVEMEPWFNQTSYPKFTDIAAGAYDSYLTTFANAIKAHGQKIMLTYAHEMNGDWYPWGNGGPQDVTPDQWLASWKHVHDHINSVAPGLVEWVWAPNNADVGSVVPYYPGDEYVDIPAYDGYIQSASQTFANFQQVTVDQIRSVTSKRIWNAECGVKSADGTQPQRISQFIKDMKNAGLAGFMWWNQAPYNVTGASLQAVINGVNGWNA